MTTHLLLDVRRQRSKELGIDFRDSERLRFLLDLLSSLLNPLKPQLLHYHLLADVFRQCGQERRVDSFR